MDKEKLAKKIYDLIGPAENIEDVTNCMTRLRVHLTRQTPEMLDELSGLEGVLGLNDNEGELQIILGPGKAQQVTEIVKKLLAGDKTKTGNVVEMSRRAEVGDGTALHAAIRQKNATPVKLFFKKIASIFYPLIPAFIACGLITGLLNIALKVSPELNGTPPAQMLAVMGNAVFFGLNLFVGVNAAREFGGTPILGGVLAAVITHPLLSQILVGDSALVPGRGGIIAVILVAAFGAWLEKKLHRLVPEMLDLFATPLLVLLIAGFAALLVLQPLGSVISEAIGTAATVAVNQGGALAGFVMGALWLPVVMLGIHQAMTPIHAELLARDGVTILLPILAMAGCGQIGASLAVYFKTKNRFLKKTVLSALPVGFMGVGEPLIYGVTLPLGKPFIGACLGGAAGGAIEAYFAVGAGTMGLSGLPLAAVTDHMAIYLAGLLVAYAIGFIATWLIGFEDPPEIN